MSDERPKKTWKEIDAAREKKSARRDPDERQRDRVAQTAAYSKYKSNLEKLFQPGGAALPESLREKLGPPSAESSESRTLLEALRNSPSADTLRPVLEKGLSLPEDPRLLTGLVDVRDESLLRPVLDALLQLQTSGKKPNRMLLLQRLEAARVRAIDDETLAAIARLKDVL